MVKNDFYKISFSILKSPLKTSLFPSIKLISWAYLPLFGYLLNLCAPPHIAKTITFS